MRGGLTVATREQRRAEHFPRIAKMLRAHDFRSAFSDFTGVADHHTIVIALPDDNMAYVFGRLSEARCRGMVALAKEGPVEWAAFWPASRAQVADAKRRDDVVVIDDDSTVDMFFECLRIERTMIIKAKLAAKMIENPEIDRELLDVRPT
jgi:hypothetical protein